MDASHQKRVMELQNNNNILRTENEKLKLELEENKKDTDSLLNDLQMNNDMQLHEISELKKQVEIKNDENQCLKRDKYDLENQLKELKKDFENFENMNSNYRVDVYYIYINIF